MTIAFALVDVFADRPLTGNPLAVVPDADDLSLTQMRDLAREFNQAETTFLLTPSRPDADHRLRSFTAAGHEVGGAGHNALGAWLWLAHDGRVAPGTHRQQIVDDVLELRLDRTRDGAVAVTMTQSAPRFLSTVEDVGALADALGVDEADIDATLPVQVVSTGAGHLLVPVRSRRAVDRLRVEAGALRAVLARVGGEGCYVYSTESGSDGVDAYCRFFNPTMGIVEDPATGTAAGPLAALLVRHGRVGHDGAVAIQQGHAAGRPSRMTVSVDGDAVRLSGGGLVVAEGRIAA